MENTQPKYEYHLLTWGGFYNEEYLKIHNIQSGDYYFDTSEEILYGVLTGNIYIFNLHR
jgi:hypothetical protein